MTRIELVRSGGFAGLSLRAAVDTSALDDPDAAWFASALDGLDLTGLAASQEAAGGGGRAGAGGRVDGGSHAGASPGQPDRFRYDLAIDRDGDLQQASFAETALPDPLRPLVQRLVERARAGRSSAGRGDQPSAGAGRADDTP